MGVFMQSTQHWSFYATVGAPEVEDSFETGIHNVYTAWYTADAQVSALYTFKEALEGSLVYLVLAGSMVYFNKDTPTNFAFIAGIVNVLAAYLYVSNMSWIMMYAVINSVYLQSRYDPTKYVAIKFGTFFNAFGGEGENAWL